MCVNDHLPPSSAEVKNEWSCNSTPPICLHIVDRDSRNYFYLYLYLVKYLAMGWMRGNGIPIPTGTADFYILCFVEIGFGACSRVCHRLRSGLLLQCGETEGHTFIPIIEVISCLPSPLSKHQSPSLVPMKVKSKGHP